MISFDKKVLGILMLYDKKVLEILEIQEKGHEILGNQVFYFKHQVTFLKNRVTFSGNQVIFSGNQVTFSKVKRKVSFRGLLFLGGFQFFFVQFHHALRSQRNGTKKGFEHLK